MKTVIMPRTLTAENGAKALLSGEFKEKIIMSCLDCDGAGVEAGEVCEGCGGAGNFSVSVPVSWTTIKAIYSMAVKHLAV